MVARSTPKASVEHKMTREGTSLHGTTKEIHGNVEDDTEVTQSQRQDGPITGSGSVPEGGDGRNGRHLASPTSHSSRQGGTKV